MEDYKEKTAYGINVTKELFLENVDFILNISASPFSINKSKARDGQILSNYEKEESPFLYVNCVGTQNNGKSLVTFDGDSMAFGRAGNKLTTGLKPYEEGILYFEYNECDIKPCEEKEIKKRSPIQQKHDAIIEAIRNIDEWCGYHPEKIVLGMSGGIDSSLSACLLVEALGKDRVLGITLPSAYNSEMTQNFASKLAEDLDIEFISCPIKHAINTLMSNTGIDCGTLHEENLHARIRGLILQSYAGTENGVVCCNGNKVEAFAGYFTMLGDDIGAFAPLADLTKVEIFEMAKMYPMIPQELLPDVNMDFSFAPSAELKDDQRDPFNWGIDDQIVEMVCNYHRASKQEIIDAYDRGEFNEELIKKYFGDIKEVARAQFVKHLDWLFGLYRRNVFKRNQYPPVVVTSKSAFGSDYRESLA